MPFLDLVRVIIEEKIFQALASCLVVETQLGHNALGFGHSELWILN